ncbi:hypothetical protein BH11VER1_BH11VER1_18340 [soil metagenome]
MKVLASLALFVVTVTAMAAEPVQPDIKDGVWRVPFRYWSQLSPIVDGTGGFDFLCEVKALGKDVPRQDHGPFRYKTGILKVLEVLNADANKFPAVKTLKTLQVEGCEGLKVGDRLILFVDGEPYENGYVIDHHRGTNCLIGHRLARADEEVVYEDSEALLIDLVRKGRTNVSQATVEELHILALMDPAGVGHALIREVAMDRLKWVSEEKNPAMPPIVVTPRPHPVAQINISGLGQPRPVDLKGKLPEDFDWDNYFALSDRSTMSDYQVASDAWPVLRRRIDELCGQHRTLMTGRGDTKALTAFDEMQANWEKAAEAEIGFVRDSWQGTGGKVAHAKHRFMVYLRRAKELVYLKGASLFLNE